MGPIQQDISLYQGSAKLQTLQSALLVNGQIQYPNYSGIVYARMQIRQSWDPTSTLYLNFTSDNISGSSLAISAVTSGYVTLTGLSGVTTDMIGLYIVITDAATPANNGSFLIVEYLSSSSVQILNANGVYPDANSGGISWNINGGLAFISQQGSGGGYAWPPTPGYPNAITVNFTSQQTLVLNGGAPGNPPGNYFYDLFMDSSSVTSNCAYQGNVLVTTTVSRSQNYL